MSRALSVLTVLVLVAACDRPGDPAKAREFARQAMKGVLAYPNSNVTGVAAGDEAAQLTLSSPDSVEAIVAWYRRALPASGWTLQREARGKDGELTLFAERQGRPLWITLHPNVGGKGTSYTLVGTAPDSSTSKP